ncbi:hypothetical protein [Cupriavidus sp. SW-Y-13]|uniref:hypothetical protein n=1 Tax=Cupriavidus sp. SW-Y-13 TaxID=2653854 RepID=UPI00136606A5|nr:hypothetical protein [Cupriavidus sp. SW-Y-13]MWL86959.1 hypothetical protein [Cupriavidus sp. SW-Y-13]
MTRPSPGIAPDGIADAEGFSLVRNDLLFRLQRGLGLIPAAGLGIGRRALFYSMLCWLPLVIWAWSAGRMMPGSAGEPLLGHYGVHVRCLVAIPLMILGEALAQGLVPLCFRQFVRNGIVDEALLPRFHAVIRSATRLRDRAYPWVVIGALVVAWTASVMVAPNPDEIAWSGDATGRNFGAWWLLLVVRPLFTVLLLAWIWRLVLAAVVLWRVAKLPLHLVPTHPDHVGGLGFLSRLPVVFAPFTLAVSSVVAASWAHQVAYHGTSVPSLYIEMVVLAIVLIMLVALPLLCFTPLLLRTKKIAMLEYGALLSEHGRKVQRRWLAREPGLDDDAMLNAPELGATADTQTIYESVTKIRPIILNKGVLLAIAVPAALPMLLLVAGQYPLKATLLKLLTVLL